MRVLILANYDAGLYKFRHELLEALICEKYEVHISLPRGEYVPQMEQMGCVFHDAPLNRHGTNPIRELQLLHYYQKLLREVRPDVVLTYTIKPDVYGGMACVKAGVPYIAVVTGLGIALQNGGLMRRVALLMYRIGLWHAKTVFFENAENERFMRNERVLRGKSRIVSGAGVNLERFKYKPYPSPCSDELVFSTVGRMMRDKGSFELLEAVRRIKENHPHVKFRLIGFFDGNCENAVMEAVKRGDVEYVENQHDVRPFYIESHAIIHPSYHEGMSNVLLEAAATGRPVLASNIPGCREAFDEGVSGMGFEPRNVDDLVRAIEQFIALPYEKKAAMGKAGREKMEREFDRRIVVDAYMKEIEAAVHTQ